MRRQPSQGGAASHSLNRLDLRGVCRPEPFWTRPIGRLSPCLIKSQAQPPAKPSLHLFWLRRSPRCALSRLRDANFAKKTRIFEISMKTRVFGHTSDTGVREGQATDDAYAD